MAEAWVPRIPPASCPDSVFKLYSLHTASTAYWNSSSLHVPSWVSDHVLGWEKTWTSERQPRGRSGDMELALRSISNGVRYRMWNNTKYEVLRSCTYRTRRWANFQDIRNSEKGSRSLQTTCHLSTSSTNAGRALLQPIDLANRHPSWHASVIPQSRRSHDVFENNKPKKAISYCLGSVVSTCAVGFELHLGQKPKNLCQN